MIIVGIDPHSRSHAAAAIARPRPARLLDQTRLFCTLDTGGEEKNARQLGIF